MTISTVKKSVCHLCLGSCGVELTIKDNNIVKVMPDYSNPVSQGYVCEKAQMIMQYQLSADKIETPLKKVGDQFVSVSWDQAIDEIVEKLKLIDRTKIFYIASSYIDYRSVYSYELVRRLGAKYVTNVFSMEKIYPILVRSQMFGVNIICDMQNTKTHLVIGQNPWVTQHYPQARKHLNAIRTDPTCKLIVVDPCETETTNLADLHVKIRPGTDAWLLTALIKYVIDTKVVDHYFIKHNTINYELVAKKLAETSINYCLEVCGLTTDEFDKLIANISFDSLSVSTGNGVCHGPTPMATSYLSYLLPLLTGNYNNIGGMVSVINDIGPGITSDEYFTELTAPYTKHRQLYGLTSASIVCDNLYVNNDQKFDCVIIDSTNPVLRLPNRKKVNETLEKIDLVIALDSFVTESSKCADYILPIQTYYERDEVEANHVGCAVVVNSALQSERKCANQIYETILDKLGLIDWGFIAQQQKLYQADPILFFDWLYEQYESKNPIVYHLVQHTVGHQYRNKSISVVWWRIFAISKKYGSTESSIKIADEFAQTLEQTGTAEYSLTGTTHNTINLVPSMALLASLKLNTVSLDTGNYKFILQCGYRTKNSVNSLIHDLSEAYVEISKSDAISYGIKGNEEVEITTDSGSITLRCKIVKNQQLGLIRIFNHAIVNMLGTENSRDYLNPRYKYVHANIRKINGHSQINN